MTDTPEAPASIDASSEAPAAPKRGGGPRTPAGRERSRRNAIQHGLCSKVVLPDDLGQVVARRTAEFAAEFQPRTPYEQFQVRELALASARLDRCAAMTILDIDRVIQRAELIWDHDRRIAVADLGSKLAKDPARVAPALRRCTQGADWLIDRWESLGEILRNKGAWTDEQRSLAYDLLGVPPAVRDGCDMLPPPEDVEGLAERAAEQVALLREDQEAVLDKLDATERAMAASGMPMEEDAPTARLRKYEASCRRAFNAARAELLRLREAKEPTVGKARAEAPPPSHRAPLSDAALDYLAKRSSVALEMQAAARSAQAAVAEKAVAVAPLAARPAPVPAAAPAPNRRERRAQAKRDRQAARRAGR